MSVSEANVATQNGSRYLQQLCKHWSHKFTVEFTPDRGAIDFGDGRTCVLEAGPEALRLRAAVPEGGDTARFEQVIADHIKRFAFREDLRFDWLRASD